MSRLAFLTPLVLGSAACLDSTQPLREPPAALRPQLSLVANITALDPGTLGGNAGFGAGLSTAGRVAGTSTTASGDQHAFFWDGTTMRDLGTLGGSTSGAGAPNAADQVAGASTTASGAQHAFFWDGTTMRDLGTLGGNASSGQDLNDAGQVAGLSKTASGAD